MLLEKDLSFGVSGCKRREGEVDFPMSVSTEPITLNEDTPHEVQVNVITDVKGKENHRRQRSALQIEKERNCVPDPTNLEHAVLRVIKFGCARAIPKLPSQGCASFIRDKGEKPEI